MLSRSITVALMLTLAAVLARAQENNRAPSGYVALFNGQDLTGWYGLRQIDPRKLAAMSTADRAAMRTKQAEDVRSHWRVENGELVNDGKGVYLATDKDYRDFDLWIDYKTVPEADSGIYLRGNPQVQIWDYTEAGGKWNLGADKGSGGLWNNRGGSPGKDPLVLADNPFGQWNRFRVVQVGARTSVWLNGKKVVDHAIMDNFNGFGRDKPHFHTGPIQLQTHGGEIRWRNIFIRELDEDDANKILATHGEEGFETVFNGRDFAGWEGPTDNYEVRDGVLMCKAGKGGTIYTSEEYGDFAARLEFKLPPGGNNGLAIRYPGRGDTAYVGMCELQVLDTEHPRYKSLDPRQAHGSAYGIVAAHRGYLRPTGAWNFQEVTVRGSTIRVELNGTVIMDADLAEVNQYMGRLAAPRQESAGRPLRFRGPQRSGAIPQRAH